MDNNLTQTPTPVPNPTPTPVPNPTPAAAAPAPTLETGPAPTMSLENAFEGGAAIAGAQSAFASPQPDLNIGATEPITMPDPIPEPDPVEEALKAPVKAAAPVPGSIGSAVSVPAAAPAPAPAEQPAAAAPAPAGAPVQATAPAPAEQPVAEQSVKPAKKKNKALIWVLLAILVLAGLITAAAIFLPDLLNDGINKISSGITKPAGTYAELSCKYSFNSSELLANSNAIDGTKALHVEYLDGELVEIVQTVTLEYENSSFANTGKGEVRDKYINEFRALDFDTDPFTSSYTTNKNIVTAVHSAKLKDLTANNMKLFNLSLAKDKTIDTSIDSIKTAYEKNGYSCLTE